MRMDLLDRKPLQKADDPRVAVMSLCRNRVVSSRWMGLLAGFVWAWFLMAGNCGKVVSKEGGPCSFDSECEVNLRCIERVCARGNGEGKPCQEQKDCPSPLRCTVGRCVNDIGQTCKTAGDCTTGQACVDERCITPIGEGGECGASPYCKSPLVCSSQNRCVTKGGAGTQDVDQSCQKAEDCQAGLTCHPTENVCKKNGTEGLSCAKAEDCETGLRCSAKAICTKTGEPGTAAAGEACTRPDHCMFGLTCGKLGTCDQAGTNEEGGACAGHNDCKAGLVCGTRQDQKGTACAKLGDPGTVMLGDACQAALDCAAGLLCGMSGKCETFSPFEGVTCQNPSEIQGPFRIFFEVPRKDKAVTEFYRLPFPNDVRRREDGTLDISGHAAPDKDNPEGMVQRHFQAIQTELKGFGVNQVVLMRFSKALLFDSLKLGGGKPTVTYVDLENGGRQGVDITSSPGRGKYICDNYLAIRPFGGTLAHGKTFAVLIMKGLKGPNDEDLQPDEDFKAMLKDEVPSDADLAKAHARYQKLREYLKKNASEQKYPTVDDVVAAAVFTTQDPDEHLAKFREVARSQPEPALKDVTLCDGKNTSPCADAQDPTRACGAPSSLFYEIHARVTLPIFQQGQAPYEKTGGKIEYESDGTPKIARTEDVCVAITIPKQAMPTGGWPIILYGHGTGGKFRSPIENKTVDALSKVDVKINVSGQPVEKTVHFATMSIDQVLHGPRRGDSKIESQLLFFNIDNPQASRENPVQAAADHFTLVRLIESLSWDKASSPTGEAVSFSADHIGYLGHSQGGVIAPHFLAYEPKVKIAALSGAGGYLVQSLLNKTKPVNVVGGMKLLLKDDGLNRHHPILNLLQMYYERADGLNTAHLMTKRADTKEDAKHILQIYGIGDTFTPPQTMDALAYVLGLTQVNPVLEKMARGISDTAVDAPVRGNLEVSGRKITAVVVQYKNENGDGHFALFQTPGASGEMARFFGSWLVDAEGTPTFSR
ncbi:MAG: hypothetical protein H6727_00515 [Myxococcales bacterium]|nr:hypothetical protein [Myxococcales bacterium]